ncbi:hypothetical protein [Micromonospora sp. WMMD710]|uniref:hypothetical protein n=1 Tax=Micromonospora sp. WMMD710 TaxID=3016085 RepID=UPI002417703A|nr:hypothetical protein [Micromonospora sp. WMMD710]MDG4760483.1 hypothetical protein [Micromonospora sp. WMMD710]
MPYATGSLAHSTPIRRLQHRDAFINAGLAQPEVARRVGNRLARYWDKLTGSAADASVDALVSSLPPTERLLQLAGRTNRRPAPDNANRFDVSLGVTDTLVIPALRDLDQHRPLPEADRTFSNLFYSLPVSRSQSEQTLTSSTAIEHLQRTFTRRRISTPSPTASDVGAGKSMFWVTVAQVIIVDDGAEGGQVWRHAAVRRLLARHVRIHLRRIFAPPRTPPRPTYVYRTAPEIDHSLESHRSRAPGRVRKTLPALVFRELAAM